MAKCTVTFNVARLGVPYADQSIKVADVEARDDGTYWTTTEPQDIPMTNSGLASWPLDRGIAYSFELPDGSTSVRLVKNAATANFSELEVLQETGQPGGFVVPQTTWVLLSTDPLPAEALPGQTYFETDTNVFGQIGA